jgi:hypothetical protein
MNNKFRVLFIFIVIGLSALACNMSQVSKIFGEYPANPGDLLFQDGFSDPSSGWDRIRTEQGLTDYENGTYRILVNSTNADFWTNPGLYFLNVDIEVDAGKISGPDDNDYGVLCRYQDTENFYFLIISSDGYYGIGIVQDGEQKLLSPPQMYQSDFIHTGESANHIQAICDGPKLALIVNGEFIAEAYDSTFIDGDIGLIVGSFDLPGIDIWFDNLMVTIP